jgi:hypothetical protein
MADHDYQQGGWRDKYAVFKRCKICDGRQTILKDGENLDRVHIMCPACSGTGLSPRDPEAVYFVLRLDDDPHARAAAAAYANSVQRENPQFAIDIRKKLEDTWKPEFGN